MSSSLLPDSSDSSASPHEHDGASSGLSAPPSPVAARGGDSDAEMLDAEGEEEYDSVAGSAGVYSNLEELLVFNPRAILPCFVVVYKA